MTKTLAPVAALLLAVALLLTGNGLLGTLIPVRAQLENFSIFSIGLLGSAYFVGFGAGCFYGPHLLRRVGHIRTFTAMASIVSAVVLGHGMIALPFPWWLMRGVTGFCFAVLYVVIESWLNEVSTNKTRGTVLSAYLVINLTVITVGQMMITLDDPATLGLFALASILVSIAVVPIALTESEAPRQIETVQLRIGKLYRTSPIAFVGCIGVGLANGAFWTLAPLFVQRSGYDIHAVALVMSATVLGGAIGQYPIGRLSDRMDRGKLLGWVALAAAVLSVGVILAGGLSNWALMAAAAAWGSLSFPLYAVAVAQANDHAEPTEYVEISSGMLFAYAGGAVIGPMVATVFMKVAGAGGLYIFTAAVQLSLAFFTYRQLKRGKPLPETEHRLSMAQAMQTAHTVSTVFDANMQREETKKAAKRTAASE
ncbi:MAG TPA: MFS transporter [Gammaproteobacteria bacterium]|nr:MFS transporter [Gammaproteobacteria bacterium]